MTQTAATATATSRSATHLRPPPQQTLDFMRTRLRARLGRWTVECTLIAYSTDFIMTLKLKLEFHRFSFGDLIRFMIHEFSRPLEFLVRYFQRFEYVDRAPLEFLDRVRCFQRYENSIPGIPWHIIGGSLDLNFSYVYFKMVLRARINFEVQIY